jgi:hypothetical protein
MLTVCVAAPNAVNMGFSQQYTWGFLNNILGNWGDGIPMLFKIY